MQVSFRLEGRALLSMGELPLAICVLLLVSFRLLEWRQLRGNPAALQGWKTDPSAYLVMVPWALTI
ncbi:hypothetical protein LLH03_04800, partial [bacterium]|nr:hypothetical protein [bacterium]